MARLVFVCLLIGSSFHAAVAAESAPSTTAPRYVVKVKFLASKMVSKLLPSIPKSPAPRARRSRRISAARMDWFSNSTCGTCRAAHRRSTLPV